MNMRAIRSAVLALGLSAAVPAIASADRRPEAGANSRAPAASVEHRDAGRQENRQPTQVEHRDAGRQENRRPIQEDHREVARRDDHIDRDDHRDQYAHRDWDQRRDYDARGGRVEVYVPAPYYAPDFDTPMSLQSVPPFVLDTVARVEPGLRIESVDYLRLDGSVFYSVRMERPYAGDVIVRVGVDGTLLGIQ